MKYKRTFYDKYIKRAIDFLLSLIAIVILSPVMVAIDIQAVTAGIEWKNIHDI